MKAKLLTENVWTHIRLAAKNAKVKSYVAVAYFGNGGAKMLPLRPGSKLIVDASEAALKAGQTNPAELIRLHNKGVKIYSHAGLHAKVFVLGTKAFIGSANVSTNSESYLQEAVFHTTERSVVQQSKEFIEKLCLLELGPERLKQLKKLYQAPKGFGAKRVRKTKQTTGALYIENIELDSFDDGHRVPLKRAREEAKERISKGRFTILPMQWDWKPRYKVDDFVVRITEEGNTSFISHPARVLSIAKWLHQDKYIVCIEEPTLPRKKLEKMAKENRAMFGRTGRKGVETTRRIVSLWK